MGPTAPLVILAVLYFISALITEGRLPKPRAKKGKMMRRFSLATSVSIFLVSLSALPTNNDVNTRLDKSLELTKAVLESNKEIVKQNSKILVLLDDLMNTWQNDLIKLAEIKKVISSGKISPEDDKLALVTKDELYRQYGEYLDGPALDKKTKCYVLKQMLVQKLLTQQADIDLIVVNE